MEHLVDRGFHLGEDGLEKLWEVLSPDLLRWEYIRDGGEGYVARFLVGAHKPEPLLSEDEGDSDARGLGGKDLAQVHHGVDVASSGIRHRHHMAG